MSAVKDPVAGLWSYVHWNRHWSYTTPKGYYSSAPVSAQVVFTGVAESRGDAWLRGNAVDEYGWWHTGVVVPMEAVGELSEVDGRPSAEAAPFPVTVEFDEHRRGSLHVLVPDDVARRLSAWRDAHWHEFVGMGDGYSDAAARGTWVHRALAYLHSVQCHLSDDMPFVEGVSYRAARDSGGDRAGLLVSTCGVRAGAFPTVGFHFSG